MSVYVTKMCDHQCYEKHKAMRRP